MKKAALSESLARRPSFAFDLWFPYLQHLCICFNNPILSHLRLDSQYASFDDTLNWPPAAQGLYQSLTL